MSKTPSFDFAIIRHGQSEANKEIIQVWRAVVCGRVRLGTGKAEGLPR